MENIIEEYRRRHRAAGTEFINGEISYDGYLQRTKAYVITASKADNLATGIREGENLLDRAERMMEGAVMPGDYLLWEPRGFTKILSIDHKEERSFADAKNFSQSLDSSIVLTQKGKILIGQSHHLHSLPRHLRGYLNAQVIDF